MTLNVALIAENEHARQRLLEFASAQHWKVAEELPMQAAAANLKDAITRFDAVVIYQRSSENTDVFKVRYCGRQRA
jgi:hypothetical protein